ncbi:MAG: hypothetical protein ABI395_07000 [Sphingobium sp.]
MGASATSASLSGASVGSGLALMEDMIRPSEYVASPPAWALSTALRLDHLLNKNLMAVKRMRSHAASLKEVF